MTSAKSIIEIDVRDQAFKDFQSLFSKYQTQLDALPGSWGKVDRAIKSTSNPVKQIGTIFAGFSEKIKAAQTAQEKFRISAQATGKTFGVMATSTGKLAKNIAGVTVNLLRWASLTSVFSGLLGAGGLFGLSRLAESAGNSRRQSQGLGVTPGEHEAAKLNYQKFVDVDSMLSKINEAKYDVQKRHSFAASGLDAGDWESQNAAQIMSKLLPQIKKRFSEVGETKQGADANGLTQYVSMEDLIRLKAITKAEIDAANASFVADSRTLSISDKTQAAWQSFNTQLERSGKQIETTLQNGLVGLAGPISHLSDAFAKAVQVFLKSPKIGEWIDSFGGALNKFASYLTGDSFGEDVKSFLDAIDTFAGSLWNVAKTIGKVFDFGGRTLKASEYRKLDELEKLSPDVAKVMRDKLTLSKEDFNKKEAHHDVRNGIKGFGFAPDSDVHKEQLDTALAGPNGAKIKALIDALGENTRVGERVKPMIDMKSLRADKSALRVEAARQMSDAQKAANASQEKWGVPAEVTLAQYKLESANGTKMPPGSNNPFGIKAKPGQPFVEAKTNEVVNGVTQRVDAKFAKFDSLSDAFEAHAKLLATAPIYANAMKKKDDPRGFADALNGTYATDPKYGEKLKDIISNLVPRDGQGSASTATPRTTVAQVAPVSITINKAPGADVYTTVHNLGYAQ